MNKEMKKRLKTAAEYQKKAILALLPERTPEHMRVIGNELKQMLGEMLAGCVANAVMKEKETKTEAESGQKKSVKKVDIV
ncbi:MAG: hypothetical protein K5697_03610 [Lachnospiraceae bacterium]|nr:hypothetical protein [Lachnospiraceae bacterium]